MPERVRKVFFLVMKSLYNFKPGLSGKKIDVCLPIKLKSKEKQLLLCLHSQLLAIYNDKLILQCHRELSYSNIIW